MCTSYLVRGAETAAITTGIASCSDNRRQTTAFSKTLLEAKGSIPTLLAGCKQGIANSPVHLWGKNRCDLITKDTTFARAQTVKPWSCNAAPPRHILKYRKRYISNLLYE